MSSKSPKKVPIVPTQRNTSFDTIKGDKNLNGSPNSGSTQKYHTPSPQDV
jgi:hypothetical protein